MHTPSTTHPLVLVAAGALTLASLAATAHYAGWLSQNTPAKAESTVLTSQNTPATAPSEVSTPAKPVKKAEHPRPNPTAHTASRPEQGRFYKTADSTTNDNGIDIIPSNNAPATSSPALCRECGVVESVRDVKSEAEGTGLGAIAGGVLGGLLGNQVGKGSGKTIATVVAAAGGAYAGHQIEKNQRAVNQPEITVRFEDGSIRTFSREQANRWRPGDRVRDNHGVLEARY